VNPRWLELSGLTSEEAIGFGWLKAVYPDDREQVKKRWETDVHSQMSSVAEYRFLRNDGSIVWVMGNAVPEVINNGIAGYIGTITDITKRKLAENALAESETKYRMIFENVQDLYYETSINGTILTLSPSIEALSKGLYRQEDLVGKSMYDFYADINERKALISHITEKGTISDFEITMVTRNGTRIPCSVSAKVCFDAQGHPEKIIGSMHDITDRKNVTEALRISKEKAEASDKLKTEFLNNISHEVRTPLNGILGFAEIMSQPDLSEDDKRDSLFMLHESSDRLLNTITNYMDISLITSGSLSVRKKDFIPGTILRKIYERSKSICSNKLLELSMEIPENKENITVNSDPEIFHKIISHLLNNAIKFTEKGSINFGYTILNGEVEFFVKDTGIGIGKGSLENIFKRFIKEDRGPAKLSEGSGLGLSIANGMSEVIDGKIRVESEVGVGSSFFLTIPLKEDGKASLSGIPEMNFRKVISGSLILVAEDDETNYYYLNALLTHETGAIVLHASNGREAIELFKANPGINLILMDIKMPEIDGLEATRQIKLLNKEVPVIAITAYAMSGDEEKVLAAGCDGYLSKPINKKSLMEKIKEFIKVG
jgi:PAS domain S-box-containing protein